MLSFLSYLLYRLLVVIFNLLPISAVFTIARGFAFILEHVVKYRRSIVQKNLQKAFPNKNSSELEKIQSAFYGHLANLFMENFLLFKWREYEIRNRIIVNGLEAVEQEFNKGNHVVFMLGHQANWEIACLVSGLVLKHEALVLYMPMKNKYINNFIKKSRSRTGTWLIPTKAFKSDFDSIFSDSKPKCLISVCDQNPGNPSKAHWTSFFNTSLPFIYGPQNYGKKLNATPYFVEIQAKGNGYYEAFISKINGFDYQKSGSLIDQFASLLQNSISNRPVHWLWSHKRWKYEGKEV